MSDQVITLEVARENLRKWVEADQKVSLGQSYRIGTRELSRVNAKEIRESIKFWSGYVKRLETGRKKGARAKRIIPRDI
ncbi:MAG: DUF6148 family protein [Fusobacteriaceae bacterium]